MIRYCPMVRYELTLSYFDVMPSIYCQSKADNDATDDRFLVQKR